QQLKELVKAKLVIRKDYQEVPPKVEYYLSDNGKTLIPILDEIEKWGVKNKNLVDDYLREIGKI
ncbi:MAG: helix-turn-helix domain-containing protein, partial [Thermodesulfobacteriota bacterium]|nr:helix-turn-helix domain-containing protein [Thermodesulfobacteriota bacterium]